MEAILRTDDLTIEFRNKKERIRVVDKVSFQVRPGEILGIVGESGCGKSMVSLAVMRLLPPGALVTRGEIHYQNDNILEYTQQQMRSIRGNEISIIFQDPGTALNPTATIGAQLMEPFRIHQKCTKKEAYKRAAEMIERVGIPSPEQRMKEFPHQMSGGMRQRIVIACALACRPRVLIADEPTTALDVTIQAQILDLIASLCRENNTAVILITHDMGIISERTDQILVLYGGQMVEYGVTATVLEKPMHPYTGALLRAIPGAEPEGEKLYAIPGTVPEFHSDSGNCMFAPRCEKARRECFDRECPVYSSEGRLVRCIKYGNSGKGQEE